MKACLCLCVCVQEKALQEAQLTISQLDAAVATLHQQLSRCLSRAHMPHIPAHSARFDAAVASLHQQLNCCFTNHIHHFTVSAHSAHSALSARPIHVSVCFSVAHSVWHMKPTTPAMLATRTRNIHKHLQGAASKGSTESTAAEADTHAHTHTHARARAHTHTRNIYVYI